MFTFLEFQFKKGTTLNSIIGKRNNQKIRRLAEILIFS